MSQFIQLHLLTSYPPSNLNRDDLGRPKTAKMGGFDRLRISSQSLKRNWRVSELFESAMAAHIGTRTKRFGIDIFNALVEANIAEKQAKEWAVSIAGVFGKNKKADKNKPMEDLEIEQLAHISPTEKEAALALVAQLVEENREPTKDELKLLKHQSTAVDIALFGRMLASSPEFNTDAACQVAHALSVHSVVVEDDYFTAVDDLNDGNTDSGSAHIGESGFAAALFYSNININKTQLIDNLNGDETLANRAIQALVEAAVKVSPKGKQNSFASSAYASFALAEKGEQQPRNLSVAFLRPVNDEDQISAAIQVLQEQVTRFDDVYGKCADSRYHFDTNKGEGSVAELLEFVAS
ncbi:type I-E CRISPR-associated protein Cas7/Cse4/CasC [Alteromonas sp. KS69]|jgi:CRISPR system Cascade subunit CasC|uniref:type I-E CRISPR-associated protein Cas7/Cse4/CasC n=1 Tax=Alteromonas sp. KS69 TaxID=2109917 RepID=UPI000F869B87|nr:type I-E CRISPR-associated protein Cas7/Cse4/CasC [Alteromonas sp. KS69]RUP82358.1 type I-E CRISPR-associated protein Cas7/Cse4/CasC [Alteromonas sp. KS69]|tara:strand:- start:378 stop:1433 length:1056 start_codon:yes stop_codon:yes gene_type:complete